MNKNALLHHGLKIARWTAASLLPALLLALAPSAFAAPASDAQAAVVPNARLVEVQANKPRPKVIPVQQKAIATGYPGPSQIGPAMNLVIGKSTLLRLPAAIDRISVGNPLIADVTLISSSELYLLGKQNGSTNIIMWRKGGATTIVDVFVGPDAALLQERLRVLLPRETGVQVNTAAESVVLSGTVSNALAAGQVVEIAEAFLGQFNRGITAPVMAGSPSASPGAPIAIGASTGRQGNARVVNMMKVAAPQQVMLEVVVAEVQKTLLDKLGSEFKNRGVGNGSSWTYSLFSSFLTGSPGVIGAASANGLRSFTFDAAKKDGLIKILAEPNIISISGQEASFLAGGKIFLPVASTPNGLTGMTTVTLEEKEFGVGLKFTPTVLDGGRINLRVSPEVSELSQTGTPFTTVGNVTAILPSMTTRRAQTTVQLFDGQSIAIAGLIKNNVTETVNRFPLLGEIPILGALYRSSEFQNDLTELMIVITPRLVKPLPSNYSLPTDSFIAPERDEFFLGGKMEGTAPADKPKKEDGVAPAQPTPPAAPVDKGGFEVK